MLENYHSCVLENIVLQEITVVCRNYLGYVFQEITAVCRNYLGYMLQKYITTFEEE